MFMFEIHLLVGIILIGIVIPCGITFFVDVLAQATSSSALRSSISESRDGAHCDVCYISIYSVEIFYASLQNSEPLIVSCSLFPIDDRLVTGSRRVQTGFCEGSQNGQTVVPVCNRSKSFCCSF